MTDQSHENTMYGYGTLMNQLESYINQLENNSYNKISKEKVIKKLRSFLDYGEN